MQETFKIAIKTFIWTFIIRLIFAGNADSFIKVGGCMYYCTVNLLKYRFVDINKNFLYIPVRGLNFIKVLCTAFLPVTPKSVRIQSSCQYLFTLLGSTGAKTALRTLVKLTPAVNFFNIISTTFMLVYPKSVIEYSSVISIFLRFWDLRA